MNKTIIFLVLLLILGGGFAAGYRVHPENLSYYFKFDKVGPQNEIVFKDGKTLNAEVLSQEGSKVTLEIEGARVDFQKAEIQAIKAGKPGNILENFQRNFNHHKKPHPLISNKKENSFQHSFDSFINESDKISQQIRKEHPEVTGQAAAQQALANAQLVQAQARARQEAAIREMENDGY